MEEERFYDLLQQKNITLLFDEAKGEIASLNDGIKEYAVEKIPVFELSFRDKDGKQTIEIPALSAVLLEIKTTPNFM